MLQADFSANIQNSTTCAGSPVVFTDSSQCFSNIVSSYWSFGDGSNSTLLNPPPHYYFAPGNYIVKHTIAGIDGCVSDTTSKTITVGAKPLADFSVNDVCFKNIPTVIDQSSCTFGTITQWTWLLDGSVFSNSQPIQYLIL